MEGISIQGRSRRVSRSLNLGPGDAVASVAVIEMAQPQGEATAEGPDTGPPPEQLELPGDGTSKKNGATSKPNKSNGASDGKPAARVQAPASKSSAARTKSALSKADAAIRKAGSVEQDGSRHRAGQEGPQEQPWPWQAGQASLTLFRGCASEHSSRDRTRPSSPDPSCSPSYLSTRRANKWTANRPMPTVAPLPISSQIRVRSSSSLSRRAHRWIRHADYRS